MAADAPLTRAPLLWRHPPAGSPLSPALLGAGTAPRDTVDAVARRLGMARVDMLASGREALRRAFVALAETRERPEVVIPAYTCYSVAAAAVAAGVKVRLVDVTATGAIDIGALERLPLERAAAVVVCNLFGVPEPVEATRRVIDRAGGALVDDAAQTLGAQTEEGPVGGRGDVGILSFARGKPLAAMGGGALVWREAPAAPAPMLPTPHKLRAAAVALAHDLALAPFAFGWIAALPGLHVGETRFEPEFSHEGLSGEALVLMGAKLETLDADNARRRRHAETLAARIRAETRFEPIVAPDGQGVYPRLALRAPDAASRDAALDALTRQGAGASAMYPRSLDALAVLASHRVGREPCPAARDLAERILTVPALVDAEGRRGTQIVAALSSGSR